MDASRPVPEQPPTRRAMAAVVGDTIVAAEEAGAAEAAEERSTDVVRAAQLVADAADADYEVRESTAAATALALALAAERTATQVQAQADTTAAALNDAAAEAAMDHARAIASGKLPDEAEQARAVACEVSARAASAAQETRRAAAIVEVAVVAAASTVVDARGVAEHRIQNDVAAARWTLEQQVAVTASRVARTRIAHAERVTFAVLAQVAALAEAHRGRDEPGKD